MTDASIDRRDSELCALSELKNALRSGDVWVQGSRQFKDFDDYLMPAEKFTALQQSRELPLAVQTNSDQHLRDCLELLGGSLPQSTVWRWPMTFPMRSSPSRV